MGIFVKPYLSSCLLAITIPLVLPIVEEIKTCVQNVSHVYSYIKWKYCEQFTIYAMWWTTREFPRKSLVLLPLQLLHMSITVVWWLHNSIILGHC